MSITPEDLIEARDAALACVGSVADIGISLCAEWMRVAVAVGDRPESPGYAVDRFDDKAIAARERLERCRSRWKKAVPPIITTTERAAANAGELAEVVVGGRPLLTYHAAANAVLCDFLYLFNAAGVRSPMPGIAAGGIEDRRARHQRLMEWVRAYPTAEKYEERVARIRLECANAIAFLDKNPESNTPAGPRGAEGDGRAAGKSGERWREVRSEAVKRLKRNGGSWPGLNALARDLECAKSTLVRAVDESPYLRARKAEHESNRRGPREVPMADAVRESAAQATEPDPADEIERLAAEQRAEQKREDRQHQAAQRRSR